MPAFFDDGEEEAPDNGMPRRKAEIVAAMAGEEGMAGVGLVRAPGRGWYVQYRGDRGEAREIKSEGIAALVIGRRHDRNAKGR